MKKSIMRLQKKIGVPADGVMGPETVQRFEDLDKMNYLYKRGSESWITNLIEAAAPYFKYVTNIPGNYKTSGSDIKR